MQDSYAFKLIVLPPEPKSQHEARSRLDVQDWIDSEWIEMDTTYLMGAILYVPTADLPQGTTLRLIPTKFAHKCKLGDKGQVIKKKGRFNTLRELISVAAQERWKLVTFNIKGAFMVLETAEDQNLYIQLLKGYKVQEGMTVKLDYMLYGCSDSTRKFWETLSTWMEQYCFQAVNTDKTLLCLKHYDWTLMIIALYVNDGLIAHNSNEDYAKFIKALSERFELSAESTKVTWYLGVGVERNWGQGLIKLVQTQYVNDLLVCINMTDCNPVLTLMEVGHLLLSTDCPDVVDKANLKEYQQLMGSLNYLVAWTRSHLAFPVSQCSRFMANPGPSHIAEAKKILRDAKGLNQLYAYVDTDHAGDPEGRHSVTGYAVMMNRGAISWESKRQKVTALSLVESEFYAASACGCKIFYL
eukprot:118907-Rhodomonas_salina.1